MELVEAAGGLDGDVPRLAHAARTHSVACLAADASAQQRASGTPCGA
jgi:hypothetical protein